jgi:hypothetical protein
MIEAEEERLKEREAAKSAKQHEAKAEQKTAKN